MTQKRYLPLFLFILVLSTLACTCGGFDLPFGGDEEPVDETPAATAAAEQPDPTDTPEPEPTDEPAPTATAEPAPTATDEPASSGGDGVELANEALGVTLYYPENWVVEEDDDFGIQVASRAGLFDDEVFDTGAGVLVFVDPSLGLIDPIDALGFFTGDFGGDDDVTLEALTEPEALEINGQDGAQVRYQLTGPDGQEILGIFTALRTEENAAIIFGAVSTGDADEFLDEVEAVINSVVLTAPTGGGDVFIPGLGSGAADDVYPIAPGTVYSGIIGEEGSASFTFEALADRPLAVMSAASDEFDQVMTLLDAEGQELDSVDDGFSGEGELIVFTPETAGSFEVNLRGFAGDGGEFSIVLLPLDAADGPGILLTDADTTPEDGGIDYTLTVSVGEAISLLLTPEEDFDITMALYDSEDNLIVDLDDGFSGEPEMYIFFPPDSGDFRLNIAGWAGGSGAYELIIGGAPVIELEPGSAVPQPGDGNGNGALPGGGDAFDTVFPLPEDARDFIGQGGDELLIFTSDLTLEELAEFYREALTAAGFTKRDLGIPDVLPGVVNMVFDGDPAGRELVVQAVETDEGTIVTIRFE